MQVKAQLSVAQHVTHALTAGWLLADCCCWGTHHLGIEIIDVGHPAGFQGSCLSLSGLISLRLNCVLVHVTGASTVTAAALATNLG